jgi:arginase family enzyme
MEDAPMRLQILNFDDALLAQQQLLDAYDPDIINFTDWGPKIRLGCSFRQFRRFEDDLDDVLGNDPAPTVTMLGSGDFHHVSLALVRRVREPFVLLMLDNHPDWMSGFPFLHCGTWLRHALRLPLLQRVLHLGGNTDFDNGFRCAAPKREIRGGKIVVVPGRRAFCRGFWKGIANEPLLDEQSRLSGPRLESLLAAWTPFLASRAVYVTFDKDVLAVDDAPVNWDSGRLRLPDALEILNGVFESCQARLVGMDVIGDWSAVRTEGPFRRALHLLEHPSLEPKPVAWARINEETNLSILQLMDRFSGAGEASRSATAATLRRT